MKFLQRIFSTNASPVISISPQALACQEPRPRIVDVREPAEFNGELGHIPGSRLVPLATLEHEAPAWAREPPIVVVCRSGARSAKAAELLVRLGFLQVLNLTGGTQAHVNAGLAVDR